MNNQKQAKRSDVAVCCIHGAMMLRVADEGVIDTREKRARIRQANNGQAKLLIEAAKIADEMVAALREVEWIFDGEEDITNNGGPNNAMKALAVVRAALRKAGAA
jgi:hypothetical protein